MHILGAVPDHADDALVVYVTAPPAEAPPLARALVDRGLAACVNVIPTVRSIYRWQGQVEDEGEALLLVKTTRGTFDRLAAAITELHSYDVPEVLAVPVAAGSPAYLGWLRDQIDGAER